MPFSTKDPTVVYIPPGNYLVSCTLPLYFYTHLMGNFKCVPTITLAPGAFGTTRQYVVDAYPSDGGGEHTDEASYITVQRNPANQRWPNI